MRMVIRNYPFRLRIACWCVSDQQENYNEQDDNRNHNGIHYGLSFLLAFG